MWRMIDRLTHWTEHVIGIKSTVKTQDYKDVTKLYTTLKRDMPTGDSSTETGLKEFQDHYDKNFNKMRNEFFVPFEKSFDLASDSTLKEILANHEYVNLKKDQLMTSMYSMVFEPKNSDKTSQELLKEINKGEE